MLTCLAVDLNLEMITGGSRICYKGMKRDLKVMRRIK